MDLRATSLVSTALLIEPDGPSQRGLLRQLTLLGHRVVPVGSVDQGIDLAQRFRFDLLLCSKNVGTRDWIRFSENTRKLPGEVILIDGTLETLPQAEGRARRASTPDPSSSTKALPASPHR